MKKMIWFTKSQLVLLEELKNATGMNNAEIVRAGMELLKQQVVSSGTK